ncbi:sulfatase-like hydrolase/transferase [Sphingobium sp. HBC34]|uniref:Sulfatase-like hydrolase/transferase n=1 Tax=Sphingobium cyanobacteriorum TaxID=3063954 RepID=A0ABT8ZMK4_9SPHN|nr:sulfatase-like hydrolase/transferase [Sphingobium sp. HBC34]MDO7835760.1 sulfatase-like hydrolase/transferase [Sphingobium sp. HBC34]
MTHEISRRAILGSAAGLAAAAGSGALAKSAKGERPNILWIVSEDNNPYVGAYGDRLARTPTIDGLAKKGLLFRHVYSNAPVCAPSRFGILTGVYPESCAPANQMRAIGKLPKDFRTYPELMRGAGYFCTNNAKTDYNCDVDPAAIWDGQGKEAHWRARTDKTQPFMAVFNYETTHESRIFKPVPGRVTPDMVTLPPFLPDRPGIRQDFASYYNLMEKMDGQLAERLAELEADGLADNTIVFHYSDNGGVLGRSKRYCYEEGLRCEMVVYVPPKWRHLMPAAPGSEITTPVSFIDLAPTVLSLAGAVQPPQMRGTPFLGPKARPQALAFGMRNRMDERIDFQRTVTDGRWRYIRNYMPHRPWGQHQAFEWLAKGYQDWEQAHIDGGLNAVQDRFFQTKPFEELYDLSADPHEIHDLARDPAYAATLSKFSRLLDKHMIAINDNGFLPETMAGEGWGPSRDPKLYPLKDVMTLARVAAAGGEDALPRLKQALTSPVEVIRYWAAMGLVIQGQAARAMQSLMAERLAADPSAHVRIQLGEALAKCGETDQSVPALIGLCDATYPWQVRLHAINALTFIGDAAKPALAVATAASDDRNGYVARAAKYLELRLTGRYAPTVPTFDMEAMMARMKAGGGPD